MSKKEINGTIYSHNNGNYNFYAFIQRLQQDFIFTHDPSMPAVHVIPITVHDVQTPDDTDYFISSIEFLNTIKYTDTIVFALQTEGWTLFLKYLNDSVNKYLSHIPASNIFYASEQLNFSSIKEKTMITNHGFSFEKPDIKQLSMITQDSWLPSREGTIKIPHSYELKDKIFLCYNRRTAPHRCQLVSLMSKHNLLKNSLVSLNCQDAKNTILEDVFLTESKKQDFINFLPSDNLSIEPWELNSPHNSEYIKYARHHARSMISVVTETHWYEPELTFTEKIYRPISFGHPFIVVGQVGYLKKLREVGFKTFSNFINEHYDDIVNPHLRLAAIIDEMKNIYSLDDVTRKNLFENMYAVAEENLEIFHKKEFTKKTFFYSFLDSVHETQSIHKKIVISQTEKNYVCELFNGKMKPIKQVSDNFFGEQIFYYSVYDEELTVNNIIWDNLKKFKNSKLVYDTHTEPVDYKYFTTFFNSIFKTHGINHRQLFILVHDEVQKKLLTEEFEKNSVFGVNIDFYMKWLVEIPHKLTDESSNIMLSGNKKRFSLFSRHYKHERLLLFMDLIKNKLLDNIQYTFNNLNPYTFIETPITEIQKFIDNSEYSNNVEIEKWVNGIPYTLNNERDVQNIYSDALTTALKKSEIHIVVETSFAHPKDDQENAFFITEKTYRPIIFKMPFLIYGNYNSLKYIKNLGFKTFDGIIDESYDEIIDNDQRRVKLIAEIKRISEFNDTQFKEFMAKCNEVVDHNYDVFMQKKRRKIWNYQFTKLGIFQ